MASDQIREIAVLMQDAERVLSITGAGISAESGLPTYRGIGGLYNDKDTDHDIPIEQALSGMMMASRPDITWKYLHQVESACRGAGFNRAHEIIANIESKKPNSYTPKPVRFFYLNDQWILCAPDKAKELNQ